MRENCEFGTCGCTEFVGRSTRCKRCHHGFVWHAISKPPCDAKLAFMSTRASARVPFYTSQVMYAASVDELPA